MRVAASSTSNSVRSLPPVIEINRPRAPFMEASSISGLAIAASAAVNARFSPEASPVPIITDLMVKEGLINLDFADVRAVMREMGKAMMGTGEASGESIGKRGLFVGHAEQVLVGND